MKDGAYSVARVYNSPGAVLMSRQASWPFRRTAWSKRASLDPIDREGTMSRIQHLDSRALEEEDVDIFVSPRNFGGRTPCAKTARDRAYLANSSPNSFPDPSTASSDSRYSNNGMKNNSESGMHTHTHIRAHTCIHIHVQGTRLPC